MLRTPTNQYINLKNKLKQKFPKPRINRIKRMKNRKQKYPTFMLPFKIKL